MSGRFIICEKSGKWVMALRWSAAQLPMRLYETRTLWDCRHELLQFPASFLVLEATTANLDGVVQLLTEVRQMHTRARAIVVTDRELECWEDLLREAGALHVAYSPRRFDAITRMAISHLPAIVLPDVSLLDEFRSRMPWKDETTDLH
jgi:hypothetical protein